MELRLAALPVLFGVGLLGPGRTVHAAEISFTFGITRVIEACEDAGARIRYQSGGQWYEIAKSDVKEITGLTCSARTAPATPDPGTREGWDAARYLQMTIAVAQAQKRGDLVEGERVCLEMEPYLRASTISSLVAYADLLDVLKRPGAQAARERVARFRQPMGPGVESIPLGFVPSEELRAYATLLQEIGRVPYEVSGMTVLASAWDRVNQAAYYRYQDRARGVDVRGRC